MDAFDAGIVTTTNFSQARRIITARSKENKKSTSSKEYTVGQLMHDIAEPHGEPAQRIARNAHAQEIAGGVG